MENKGLWITATGFFLVGSLYLIGLPNYLYTKIFVAGTIVIIAWTIFLTRITWVIEKERAKRLGDKKMKELKYCPYCAGNLKKGKLNTLRFYYCKKCNVYLHPNVK